MKKRGQGSLLFSGLKELREAQLDSAVSSTADLSTWDRLMVFGQRGRLNIGALSQGSPGRCSTSWSGSKYRCAGHWSTRRFKVYLTQTENRQVIVWHYIGEQNRISLYFNGKGL